ncbi:MAG: hypothetical protein VX341_04485 [Bdellovibrionota bacterium]|nr:hypothetical protein [Bdellovibrionota bacterium]
MNALDYFYKNKYFILSALALVVTTALINADDFLIAAAVRGETPLIYVYKHIYPENFVHNFTDLTDTYDSSIAMHLWIWAYDLLSIKPENFVNIFILLETFFLAFCSLSFTKMVLPKSNNLTRYIIMAIFIASYGRNMNFARFHQPVIFGLYYCFAEGFRLLAIGNYIKKSYIKSGTFLSLSIMCHPTMGIMGAFFLFALYVLESLKEKNINLKKTGIFFISLAIGACWTLFQIKNEGVSSAGIPTKDWFLLTEMSSYHWYPISIDVFGEMHNSILFPFTGFLLLITSFLHTNKEKWPLYKNLVIASYWIMGLVALGVINSYFKFSPILTKIALHRSNDIILAVFTPFIVSHLIKTIKDSNVASSVLATIILVSSFLYSPGYPLFVILIFTLVKYKKELLNLKFKENLDIKVMFISSTLLFFAYLIIFYNGSLLKYVGKKEHFIFFIAIAVLYIILHKKHKTKYKKIALTLSILVAQGFYFKETFTNKTFLHSSRVDFAQSYLEVQEWARDNTQNTDLFVPPPHIVYGWRDISLRSSFGNIRDFVFDSWFYKSNYKTYKEGLKRASLYGINPFDYKHLRSVRAYSQMVIDSRDNYGKFTDEWRNKLATEYHVDYFVYEKKYVSFKTSLKKVFENDRFFVLKAK